MILTNCAACAAPLAHNAPRCVRCHTRYCNQTCQHDHWRRGHKQMCKKIHRGGNAEQYNADKKYKEAVAVAVEECADDTKGQKCYICLEAVHPRTGEGLVRGCACGDRDGVASGTTGIAHVSCLAEQAKILVAEAEENSLDDNVFVARFQRWSTCSLCEQRYHGVVCGALGWACWKTYVGLPETNHLRLAALQQLGNGLAGAGHHKDALSVQESEFSIMRRMGVSEENLLITQGNLASTYERVGREEEALRMREEVYSRKLELFGEEHAETLKEANNYAWSLKELNRYGEVKTLTRNTLPVARRVFGESAQLTINMRWCYGLALCRDDGATLDDLREAVTTLEETARISRRVLGGVHPTTGWIELAHQGAYAALARKVRSVGSLE